jgi:8-oxo-dGTP pyrophosphatase MutT (NUDIX family)
LAGTQAHTGMAGMTRAEVDRAENKDFALGSGPKRPRDAATLILLDRTGDDVRVLLGRRHMRHAFMPGKFVFPGGRTDPADARVAIDAGLHPAEEAKLVAARITTARARAIAMSAVRETYEEAGLLIGSRAPFSTTKADWQGFADNGVCPSLDRLRYVARAITPPGRVRRFDTRFLAAFREDVAVELPEGGPTNELEELVWLPIDEASKADIPTITRSILQDLKTRLEADPHLKPGGPVPFYYLRHNRFRRDII